MCICVDTLRSLEYIKEKANKKRKRRRKKNSYRRKYANEIKKKNKHTKNYFCVDFVLRITHTYSTAYTLQEIDIT